MFIKHKRGIEKKKYRVNKVIMNISHMRVSYNTLTPDNNECGNVKLETIHFEENASSVLQQMLPYTWQCSEEDERWLQQKPINFHVVLSLDSIYANMRAWNVFLGRKTVSPAYKFQLPLSMRFKCSLCVRVCWGKSFDRDFSCSSLSW